MKPTKIQAYEAALEKISENAAEPTAANVAQMALDLFVTDHEADRLAKNLEIKNMMLDKGLLFASAQELSDALNAAGLKTTRGKEWSKSTATRVLADVRPMIQADLVKTSGSKTASPTETFGENQMAVMGAYIDVPNLDAAIEAAADVMIAKMDADAAKAAAVTPVEFIADPAPQPVVEASPEPAPAVAAPAVTNPEDDLEDFLNELTIS